MEIETAKKARTLLREISEAEDKIELLKNISSYNLHICDNEGFHRVKIPHLVAGVVISAIVEFYEMKIKEKEKLINEL